MVNAWSLAGSILNGTLDEDYPIMDKTKGRWIDDTTITSRESDEYDIINPNEDDGLDYEINYYDDYMADIDDQRAHHFGDYSYNPDLFKKPMAKSNHQFKYHEDEILKDIHEYVSNTYNGHYTGSKHEFRKVQTIDLMAARDIASGFCQANILKYGSRYGSKDGRNKTDLLKVIHYAMLLLHFDGHYGEPSMPSGDFEQMP